MPLPSMKCKPDPIVKCLVSMFPRRAFVSALAGALAVLTGCERGAVVIPEKIVAAPSQENGGAANPSIVSIYTWDQYLNPTLLDEFKARTGIAVEVHTYESSDEMLEGLKSEPGKYDILVSEDAYIPKLAGKRLVKPLDRSRLPNWKNLEEKFTNPPYDPGNEFSVPYLWGTTLLAYRKDLLEPSSLSWKSLFDPALKDRISFLDDKMECFAGVLRTMGVNLLSEATPDQISMAADKMVSLVQEGGMRFGGDSGNEVKQHIVEGVSWISMMYSGDAALIAKDNPGLEIRYFIPEEGTTIWMDSFCISRDTTRPDNVDKFLDFMLEPKSAAASANFLRYASPNKSAAPFIAPELLADETINPRPEVLAKCQYFQLKDLESIRMVNTGWRRVMEAWSLQSGQASGKDLEPEEE